MRRALAVYLPPLHSVRIEIAVWAARRGHMTGGHIDVGRGGVVRLDLNKPVGLHA